MPATVVVGTQWGDEGKGKIVDVLAAEADVVVRFQGGANAGHTVEVGGDLYKFHLLPSGILRPETVNVIGNGVVVDPVQLLAELDDVRKRGHPAENLRVSDRAHVVLPYHRAQDALEEGLKGPLKAGTTMRGIGPCYQDKVARVGVRMADLVDPGALRDKLETVVPIKQRHLEALGGHERLDWKALAEAYGRHGERLRPYVTDTSVLLDDALAAGQAVLFEGAQGTHLCVDHGLYPYGTSSNCVAAAASVGAGVGMGHFTEVLGVVKAFTSRVGTGPFPTELDDATASHLRERGGGEYGTTTERPRRVGWLDLVMVRLAVRVNGLTGLAVTKLDVLGGLDTVRVATAYAYADERVEAFPANPRVLARCRPVYVDLPGWPDLDAAAWADVAARGRDALPEAARGYLAFLEEALGVPVRLASVGRGREATLDLRAA